MSLSKALNILLVPVKHQQCKISKRGYTRSQNGPGPSINWLWCQKYGFRNYENIEHKEVIQVTKIYPWTVWAAGCGEERLQKGCLASANVWALRRSGDAMLCSTLKDASRHQSGLFLSAESCSLNLHSARRLCSCVHEHSVALFGVEPEGPEDEEAACLHFLLVAPSLVCSLHVLLLQRRRIQYVSLSHSSHASFISQQMEAHILNIY